MQHKCNMEESDNKWRHLLEVYAALKTIRERRAKLTGHYWEEKWNNYRYLVMEAKDWRCKGEKTRKKCYE